MRARKRLAMHMRPKLLDADACIKQKVHHEKDVADNLTTKPIYYT
jgi:hypothetical protein